MDIGLGESRAVWKDLGSRRIGKSLEEIRIGDDVKGQGFLIVHTWCTHVMTEIKRDDVEQWKAHVGSMVALW